MATVRQTDRKRKEFERLTTRLAKGVKPERVESTLPSRSKKKYSTTKNLVPMTDADKTRINKTLERLKDKIDNPKRRTSITV